MADKTLHEQLKESVDLMPMPEAPSQIVDRILELDGPDAGHTSPPNLSIDVVDFENNSITHIGTANSQEMAIQMADEVQLESGQMVRVVPMVYFRVRHG